MELTQKRLKECIRYIPETGLFWWIEPRQKRNISKPAGAPKGRKGYLSICVDGASYYAHRLAWLYMMGEWPEHTIDHKNRDGGDNRWDNLRNATYSQNLANRRSHNRTGLKGVDVERRTGRFTAKIQVNGTKIHLGTFDTAQQAHNAYVAAANDNFGEFACAGQV